MIDMSKHPTMKGVFERLMDHEVEALNRRLLEGASANRLSSVLLGHGIHVSATTLKKWRAELEHTT